MSPITLSWCAMNRVYDWLPWKHILYSLAVEREEEKDTASCLPSDGE